MESIFKIRSVRKVEILIWVCKIFCVFFLWINAKTTDLLNEAHKVTCRFDY